MKLKTLLILIALFLTSSGVFYKWQEWNALRKLTQTYDRASREELILVEANDKLGNQFGGQFLELLELFAEEDTPLLEESMIRFDKLIALVDTSLYSDKEYQSVLERNQSEFKQLKKQGWFLLGRARQFYRNFVDLQNDYYETEHGAVRRGELVDIYFKYLLQTLKDNQILLVHSDKIQKLSEAEIRGSLTELGALEKYTQDNLGISSEEEIKKLYPYSMDVLYRYKNYLGSYYSIFKDIARGDTESAAYKNKKFADNMAELIIDWDKLFNEGEEESIDIQKRILELTYSILTAIHGFKIDKLGIYPLQQDTSFAPTDIVYCQSLAYKTGLYYNVRSEYPQADNLDELIKKLTDIAPRAEELDRAFDRGSVDFSNTETEMKFVCKDTSRGKEFTFTLLK